MIRDRDNPKLPPWSDKDPDIGGGHAGEPPDKPGSTRKAVLVLIALIVGLVVLWRLFW